MRSGGQGGKKTTEQLPNSDKNQVDNQKSENKPRVASDPGIWEAEAVDLTMSSQSAYFT